MEQSSQYLDRVMLEISIQCKKRLKLATSSHTFDLRFYEDTIKSFPMEPWRPGQLHAQRLSLLTLISGNRESVANRMNSRTSTGRFCAIRYGAMKGTTEAPSLAPDPCNPNPIVYEAKGDRIISSQFPLPLDLHTSVDSFPGGYQAIYCASISLTLPCYDQPITSKQPALHALMILHWNLGAWLGF